MNNTIGSFWLLHYIWIERYVQIFVYMALSRRAAFCLRVNSVCFPWDQRNRGMEHVQKYIVYPCAFEGVLRVVRNLYTSGPMPYVSKVSINKFYHRYQFVITIGDEEQRTSWQKRSWFNRNVYWQWAAPQTRPFTHLRVSGILGSGSSLRTGHASSSKPGKMTL